MNCSAQWKSITSAWCSHSVHQCSTKGEPHSAIEVQNIPSSYHTRIHQTLRLFRKDPRQPNYSTATKHSVRRKQEGRGGILIFAHLVYYQIVVEPKPYPLRKLRQMHCKCMKLRKSWRYESRPPNCKWESRFSHLSENIITGLSTRPRKIYHGIDSREVKCFKMRIGKVSSE